MSVLFAAAAFGISNPNIGSTYLTRPWPPTAMSGQGAWGTIRWKHGLPSDSDWIVFTAHKLDLAHSYTVYFENPVGSNSFSPVASLASTGKTLKAKLVKSLTGLPLGVSQPSDVFSRVVQVRDEGSHIVLTGYFPGGTFDPLNGKPYGGAREFDQPESIVDPDAEGTLVWKHWPKDGRIRIDVKLFHLNPGSAFSLCAASNPEGPYNLVAELTPVPGKPGSFRYTADTKLGQPLPFGVVTQTSVPYLQVQDSTGAVVLTNHMPEGDY